MARSDLQIHFFKIGKFHINIQFIPCVEKFALDITRFVFLRLNSGIFSVTIGLVSNPCPSLQEFAHLKSLFRYLTEPLALVII